MAGHYTFKLIDVATSSNLQLKASGAPVLIQVALVMVSFGLGAGLTLGLIESVSRRARSGIRTQRLR